MVSTLTLAILEIREGILEGQTRWGAVGHEMVRVGRCRPERTPHICPSHAD
jgi:hypothetical protein